VNYFPPSKDRLEGLSSLSHTVIVPSVRASVRGTSTRSKPNHKRTRSQLRETGNLSGELNRDQDQGKSDRISLT
jgi:hypothetical protein